jgi:hypothetical protein
MRDNVLDDIHFMCCQIIFNIQWYIENNLSTLKISIIAKISTDKNKNIF